MTRFFDPIANEYRECVTDIGRSLARRMAGEPAPETPAALTPSQIAQAMVPVPTPVPVPTVPFSEPAMPAEWQRAWDEANGTLHAAPVVPLEDGWIAHKPGDPRPPIWACHVRTADGWCSEYSGLLPRDWCGFFGLDSGNDSIVAYKVIQP